MTRAKRASDARRANDCASMHSYSLHNMYVFTKSTMLNNDAFIAAQKTARRLALAAALGLCRGVRLDTVLLQRVVRKASNSGITAGRGGDRGTRRPPVQGIGKSARFASNLVCERVP